MTKLYLKCRMGCKGKYKVLTFIVGMLVLGSLYGQDNHFTQFDYNPIFLNPANTGNFIGDWRVAGNFRNQWLGTSDPYQTATISGDKPVYLMGQKIGVGLLFVNDASGIIGLTTNKLYVSAGYGLEYANNYFNAGLQVGMVFSSVGNGWGLWNHSEGEFNLPNNEPDEIGNSLYPDVNLGGAWKRNIHIFEPEVGFNLMHINFPKKTYTSGSENVPLRLGVYATAKTKLTDEIYITPKAYFTSQKTSSMTVFGAEGGYNLLGNRSSVKRVFGGVYVRNGVLESVDAFMAQLGTTVGRLDIAFSYDLGFSELSQSETMGSFEISFIYKSISTVLNSYSIPCERY